MKRIEKKGHYNVYGGFEDESLGLVASFDFKGMKARSMKAAKAQAIIILKDKGWSLVNDDALVLEVERVYETRWDCMAMPEGVRRAA